MIERAVITASDDRLEVARYLPASVLGDAEGAAGDTSGSSMASTGSSAPAAAASGGPRVLREEELPQLERENLLRALEVSGWKVAGDDGAAERLGIPASTLRSRIQSLGIERPPR